MHGRTILVIDDSEAVRTALDVLLSLEGATVALADSPAAGLERVGRGDVDLVIQDMNFTREATSGEEGIALFRELRRRQPDLPVVLLTAWTHLETAVELVHRITAAAHPDTVGPWDAVWRVVVAAMRTVAPAHVAALGAVAALAAWQLGDGLRAGEALVRARAADPEHGLAKLLQQALDRGAPPSTWEEVMRGLTEAQCRHGRDHGAAA